MTLNEFIENIKVLSKKVIINHKNLGEGKIKSVDVDRDNPTSITAIIEFKEKTGVYSLRVLFNNNVATCDNVEFVDLVTKVSEELAEELSEIEYQNRAKQREAKKAAEKKAKEEAKYLAKKESMIKNYNGLKSAHLHTTYEVIGWLTKHAKTMEAKMPDYLEKYFVRDFGDDALHHIVDSKKKTVSGFPMQWALSMTLSVDTENMPAQLKQYLSESNNKKIANTEFVYDLAKRFGFSFAKSQDVESIRELVPVEHIKEFELGFNS